MTHKRMMRFVSNGVFHLVGRAQQSCSEHFQVAIFKRQPELHRIPIQPCELFDFFVCRHQTCEANFLREFSYVVEKLFINLRTKMRGFFTRRGTWPIISWTKSGSGEYPGALWWRMYRVQGKAFIARQLRKSLAEHSPEAGFRINPVCDSRKLETCCKSGICFSFTIPAFSRIWSPCWNREQAYVGQSVFKRL